VQTLRQVEHQIEQIRGLRDIVQSMRTLASTYLKRAEEQLESVRLYHETVVEALAGDVARSATAQRPALNTPPQAAGLGLSPSDARSAKGGTPDARRLPPDARYAAVVLFATEHGLCGRFNEVLVDRLRQVLRGRPDARVIVLGQRGRAVVEAAGVPIAASYPTSASPDGIAAAVRRVSEGLYDLFAAGAVSSIYFLHAVHESVGRFRDHFERILPLDLHDHRVWGVRAGSTNANGDASTAENARDAENNIQQTTGDRQQTTVFVARRLTPDAHSFSAPSAARRSYVSRALLRERLVEEYYFVRFFRAFVETIAAENSARLASMEAACNNIDDTLESLEGRRRILRQDQITEELMDVIAGAEAVTKRPHH
jgi:F-type H+-transporting ATPase subunit gamma